MGCYFAAPVWASQHHARAHNKGPRAGRPGAGRVVTALEGLDAQGRWLWTLSGGEDENAWLELLGDSLIQEGRPAAGWRRAWLSSRGAKRRAAVGGSFLVGRRPL